MYERVLAGRGRTLGADHPDTLASRNEFAVALEAAGRTARRFRSERNLADRERVLGTDHPYTASRHNLAVVYYNAGRTAEAIPLYEQALAGA